MQEPALPVPARYPDDPRDAATQRHAAEIGWRTMFNDRRLQRLIELALENNRDLRLAMLNVEAVQAQYGIERAARLPAIEATGSGARQRATNAGPDRSTAVQEQYVLSVGINLFELDLFGRVRSLSEAALARYLASDQGRRAAQISLVGAVADAYFAQRLAQEQGNLAEQTLNDWRQSLDLARKMKAANQHSGLDVAQAEGQVASAEADLEYRTRTAAQARNALQLLISAEPPANLPAPKRLEEQPVLTVLPAGLPSDLLLRRPDIQQAEQNLIAANAEIGAARAAFFPRLSLTASFGYASSTMNGLFESGSRVWGFTPQLSQPIFQGRLRAELRLAEVRKSSAISQYEKTIQTAFREVADGLAGQKTYRRQIAAQIRVVASAQRRAELSNLRYRAGIEGRLELLDAQRQLYAAHQALLDLRRSEFSNAIALYKALGGGLLVEDLPPADKDEPIPKGR